MATADTDQIKITGFCGHPAMPAIFILKAIVRIWRMENKKAKKLYYANMNNVAFGYKELAGVIMGQGLW